MQVAARNTLQKPVGCRLQGIVHPVHCHYGLSSGFLLQFRWRNHQNLPFLHSEPRKSWLGPAKEWNGNVHLPEFRSVAQYSVCLLCWNHQNFFKGFLSLNTVRNGTTSAGLKVKQLNLPTVYYIVTLLNFMSLTFLGGPTCRFIAIFWGGGPPQLSIVKKVDPPPSVL